MPKKLIKNSTINRIVKLLISKPKKRPTQEIAEQAFLNSMATEPFRYTKIGDQLKENSYPTLDSGSVVLDVYGTINSRLLMGRIQKKYHNQKIKLTLTPICKYQIENKWPNPPFVNVNLLGSDSTTESNWIGYIDCNDPEGIDLEGIIDSRGNVNVWASLHRENGDYSTKLHLSSKYKYNSKKILKTYVSHTSEQIKILTTIACETGEDYIQVNMKELPDQKNYAFIYDGMEVGSATINKIDSCLNKQKIHKAFIRIVKFRFDDEDENKHYSPLIIQME